MPLREVDKELLCEFRGPHRHGGLQVSFDLSPFGLRGPQVITEDSGAVSQFRIEQQFGGVGLTAAQLLDLCLQTGPGGDALLMSATALAGRNAGEEPERAKRS